MTTRHSRLKADGTVTHPNAPSHDQWDYHRCRICLILGWHPSPKASGTVCDPNDYVKECRYCVPPTEHS